MKTTNKIQKTALTAALAVSFSIFGFSIDAQVENNPLTKNYGANNLAMATVKSGNHFFTQTLNEGNTTAGSSLAIYLINETEAPLITEAWMLDESIFSSATSIETEIETPLEIEAWMIDDNTFNTNLLTIETETDKELNLEDWMMDELKFEANNQIASAASVQTPKYIFINNISYPAVITEKSLQLEDWMMDTKIWK